MKKKIFLVGKVYDLSTISVQKIIDDVQSRLDAHYGKGCCVFSIYVWKEEKEVTINFWRNYKDSYNTDDAPSFFADFL